MPRHQKKSSSKATIPSKLLLQLANQFENPLKAIQDVDVVDDDSNKKNDGQPKQQQQDNNDSYSKFFQTKKFLTKIQCFTWKQLDPKLQEFIIDLTEQNMMDFYEKNGWKWNRQSKIQEMKHSTSRHLIVFNVELEPPEPIAFCHFRFEEGYCQDATLYCYELQIIPSCKRLGIGRYLMNLLQLLAQKFRMKKILVTVLKSNLDAYEFYTKGLQFKIDQSSPSCFNEDEVYEILSKKPSTKVTNNDNNNENIN